MKGGHDAGKMRSAYKGVFFSGIVIVLSFASAMVLLGRTGHIETLKVVASAFVTLLSTLVGASVAFAFARSQMREQTEMNRESFSLQRRVEIAFQRQELAFAMHREFSSPDMLCARTEASRLLQASRGMTYGELYDTLPEERTRPLFLVSDFYGRLALAVQHERVDPQLVPELFGAYFVWWWVDAFRDRLVAPDPEWPESLRLIWLYDWMLKHSKPSDFNLWKSRSLQGMAPQQEQGTTQTPSL